MSIQQIPTMCLNCSTVCGMIAKVENGKILKLEGNPKDCLNALVGSINKKGGWRYIPGDVNLSYPQPGPLPPKPKIRTELSHPSSFPFVNEMYPRAISSTIFPYIAEKRATVDTLLSYYVNAPMSWP